MDLLGRQDSVPVAARDMLHFYGLCDRHDKYTYDQLQIHIQGQLRSHNYELASIFVTSTSLSTSIFCYCEYDGSCSRDYDGSFSGAAFACCQRHLPGCASGIWHSLLPVIFAHCSLLDSMDVLMVVPCFITHYSLVLMLVPMIHVTLLTDLHVSLFTTR